MITKMAAAIGFRVFGRVCRAARPFARLLEATRCPIAQQDINKSLRNLWTTTNPMRCAQEAAANDKNRQERLEFQAETRMLLDIVAKSLYSEKEVFLRELVSNANDALEKARYTALTSGGDVQQQQQDGKSTPQIRIITDKIRNTLTIEDSGIGMTREELVQNLGTIARSGSKAFLEELKEQRSSAATIIGQFGVGFYSAFMVADRVRVVTRSKDSPQAYMWESDGAGTYTVSTTDNVPEGTSVTLHLKKDATDFANEDTVKDVIKKYSNFVGHPILLNGTRVNTVQAIWLMDPKEVSDEMHDNFYRFFSNAYDRPRFKLHFRTDVPLSLRCALYFPEARPGLFEMSRETHEGGVALYSRNILIKGRADNLLPKWLRFVKGVVDSEDVPLNLSRELLQDGALIRRLRTVVTDRIIRFLQERMRKDTENYDRFFQDYGLFLKEGIISGTEQYEKEEIAKLLRYESSSKPEGEKVTLADYCSRLKEGQTEIYYLAAPSRNLATTSPYYEAMNERNVEVLFCYEPYDELVFLQMRQFDRKNIVSVEKEMRRDTSDTVTAADEAGGPTADELKDLLSWLQTTLGHKVHRVKITRKLSTYPCVVTVEEMGAARHFVRTQFHSLPEEQRYKILEPTLEINPSHILVKKLVSLRRTDAKLAQLLAEQLMDNAMVSAGLIEDPRLIVGRINELLTHTFQKQT